MTLLPAALPSTRAEHLSPVEQGILLTTIELLELVMRITKSTVMSLTTLLFCAVLATQCLAADSGNGNPIRHYVALKFKDGTSPQDIDRISKAFKSLQKQVPNVTSIEGGPNCSPEDRSKGFTHGFLVTFPNEKARDVYLTHPNHVKFKNMLTDVVADVFVQDVEGDRAGKARALTRAPGLTLVDLTQVIGPGLPNYHGDPNAFTYELLSTVKKDGYSIGKFCTPEHYGTHTDAPSHFVDGGTTIDKIKAEQLILEHCYVIDVREAVKKNPDYGVTVSDIIAFEEKTQSQIAPNSAVLLLTGWEDRWSDQSGYRNADSKGTMHFPGFSAEAATFLATQRKVTALGIDTLSLDCGKSLTHDVHKIALGHGLYLIENLTNLDKLPSTNFILICCPLKIQNGTGSPSRVIAVIE